MSRPLASFFVVEISFIIASAMASVDFDQASTTLVVLLALCDQAVVVLLLELLGEFARGLDGFPLRRRHHHVVLAERDAGLEGMIEAERHDAVAEDDRLFLAAVAVDLVDHPEISRFVISLLTMSNGALTLRGSTLPRITRPGVVSYHLV